MIFTNLDATKLRGEVMYWCVWPDSSGKFLSSQAVKDDYIQLAIEFFESIINRILQGEIFEIFSFIDSRLKIFSR